jgi:hypothetical protein
MPALLLAQDLAGPADLEVMGREGETDAQLFDGGDVSRCFVTYPPTVPMNTAPGSSSPFDTTISTPALLDSVPLFCFAFSASLAEVALAASPGVGVPLIVVHSLDRGIISHTKLWLYGTTMVRSCFKTRHASRFNSR